jgi:hypothetical protein
MGSAQPAALVAELERSLTDECLIALGLAPDGWARRLLEPVFRRPVRRLAQLLARFDQGVARGELSQAARELLAHFVDEVSVRGAEHIPADGPLLVAANHPGTYDGLVLIGSLGRDDLKLIASGVDLLRGLPASSRHMIFVGPEAPQRMTAVREMLRHLEAEGAVLVLASGLVDPDPDLEPGAEQALEAWSGSLELALRRVPRTRLVVSIVSGVLAGACLRHPLTRLRRVAWEKRKLAAFLQVSQQLAFGRSFRLRPRVSFGAPITLADGGQARPDHDLRRVILEVARGVLSAHLAAPSE